MGHLVVSQLGWEGPKIGTNPKIQEKRESGRTEVLSFIKRRTWTSV